MRNKFIFFLDILIYLQSKKTSTSADFPHTLVILLYPNRDFGYDGSK